MKTLIMYLTRYNAMHYMIYLVVVDGIGYIVNNWNGKGPGGNICPCCMSEDNRDAIKKGIAQARESGNLIEQVIWPFYGDTVGIYGFDQTAFREFKPGVKFPDAVINELFSDPHL